MKHLTIPAIVVLGNLPAPLLAHGGLDHSSALMVFLHSMAHAINDHPILTALLGAAVAVGLVLHHRHSAHRRPLR